MCACVYRIHPVIVESQTIYFRGIRILDAVIDALLTAGVNAADHVILTGCSGDPIKQTHQNKLCTCITPYSWRPKHLPTP